MAETQNRIRTILETIRENAQHALALLRDAEDERSLRWQCTQCGHVKYFTRPVPSDVASPCPKCKGAVFQTC